MDSVYITHCDVFGSFKLVLYDLTDGDALTARATEHAVQYVGNPDVKTAGPVKNAPNKVIIECNIKTKSSFNYKHPSCYSGYRS